MNRTSTTDDRPPTADEPQATEDRRRKTDGSCRFRGEGEHHGTYKVRRHPFEIMRPLKDGAVLIQERLAHAAEGTQEVSQARPDAFNRVGMHFADAITVIIARMGFHKGLERCSITVVTDLQADVSAAAANHPGNRWSISLPGAMPTGLVGTTARRVSWISMLVAFLASVLVEFIGFGHIVR